MPSRFARLHPKLYLTLHGIAGLALAVAGMWTFFAIAEDVPERGAMVRVDNAVALWLQVHGTEAGEARFGIVSLFGAQILTALLIGVGIALIVRRDWRHVALLAIAAGGGALLNGALKLAFHRSRPTFAAEFHKTSWSFPSGHAMDSLIAYGLLAYWAGRRWPRVRFAAYVAAALIVALIGFSRIYLGVHFLSDVVAGFCSGFVWLAACVTGYEFAERRRVGPSGEDERR
ncbi:MAG: phosphatase PAP2 family protein [Gemmatimonadales bacterium]